MNEYIILLIIIGSLCVILTILLIIVLLNSNKDKSEELKTTLNRDLLNFSNTLSTNFSNLSELTNNKLNYIDQKLTHNIDENYKSNNEIFNKINERMIKIDEAQKGLNDLSSDINNLQFILKDKKNRGTFGEIELYSLLETTFGNDKNRWDKQYSLTNGLKADAIIFSGTSLGNVVVDSKFPLENYQRIYDENLSKSERDKARISFKNDVIKHIKDIKEKYIIPNVTAEIAYMFVPAEAVFAEIYANFSEIIEKSYESKVYIVSPTTLMAYLTAIRSIYLGQRKDEKAKEIASLLNELSIEFVRLKDRQEQLQRDYEKLIPDFESVFISSNKIIKKFSKINEGDIDD